MVQQVRVLLQMIIDRKYDGTSDRYDDEVARVRTDLKNLSFKQTAVAARKQPAQHAGELAPCLAAEQRLACDDDEERSDSPENAKCCGVVVPAGSPAHSLFERLDRYPNQKNDEIVDAVENVWRLRPVPETVQHPDREEGDRRDDEVRYVFSAVLPPELRPFFHELRRRYRIENVIFEPDAEGDVPSPPEFGRALRKEWLAEVLGQPDLEDSRRADYDVDRPREFHVELHRHDDAGQQNHQSAEMVLRLEEDRHHRVHPVGNDHPLKEPPADPYEALRQAEHRDAFALKELVLHVLPPHDGSFHQCREENEEQEELSEVRLRPKSSPVDVK